jgi:hypothetical protein
MACLFAARTHLPLPSAAKSSTNRRQVPSLTSHVSSKATANTQPPETEDETVIKQTTSYLPRPIKYVAPAVNAKDEVCSTQSSLVQQGY